MTDHGYFAGGAWHWPDGGAWLDSIDPATGAVWARIPRCGAAEVDRAVGAAAACFASQAWQRTTGAGRARLLQRMADALVAHAPHLAEIETRDNGKRHRDILGALTGNLPDTLRYYASLAEAIEGRAIPVDLPDMLNYTRPVPFGVAACITAWNSPLLIAVWKIAPAIAAGNTVVLKPSEHASVSTLALAGVLEGADLPPGLVNVVTGLGDEAGRALVEHPGVGIVSFTGGLAGGRAVAAAAARGPKPVILELGGKSPQIVLDDADLDLAAAGIVGGIFPPAGQSCIAGARVIVHRSVH
ncbi:MAG: aldehyde dehydrogenase family protein, partial [Gemmobacter sp.]